MAGTGDRFIKKGYKDPKPLIYVNNKRIIEYICDMFSKNDEIIFICNENHLQTTNMRNILYNLVPGCKVFSVPNHKRGPVYTVVRANIYEYILDDEEVIICYCDNPYLWNYNNFKNWVKEKNSDGCILSHVGMHPHRLGQTLMAHIKEDNLNVLEIKEKAHYTDNVINEQASTGTYYFKKGFYIKKYFQQLMDKNINYNGEYYVTLVYNLLIKDGLSVTAYPTDFVTVFGTPEEVQNFESWQILLSNTQIKNENDLISCYNYWKAYNNAVRNT